MCAPSHTFKVQAVYKSTLTFTFCLCRNLQSNSENLLVDKLGSTPFPWSLLICYPQCIYCRNLICVQPSRTPRMYQSFKPPKSDSPDLPFTHLARVSFATNQYCRFRQLWCLMFADDCFQQCCRCGTFPWNSRSGQLPLTAASTELLCYRLVYGWGGWKQPQVKMPQTLLVLPRILCSWGPHSAIRSQCIFIPIYSLIAFHLVLVLPHVLDNSLEIISDGCVSSHHLDVS